MAELRVQGLEVHLAGRPVIRSLDLALAGGELVAVLGPNGAGKSTVLRAIMGLVSHASGEIRLDDADPTHLPARERARRIAYLPQTRSLAWPVRVRDLVALGRFAHGASLHAPTGEDARAIQRALTACTLETLADRRADTLSGGELSRVHVARALAAETPLLLADEPVAALDPRHQFHIMSLIRDYVDRGNGAMVVLHEAALAARFADRIVWLKDGGIVADGPPDESLTAERLREVYAVRATVQRAGAGWAISVDGPA